MNLSEIVDRAAGALPDHTALVYEDRRISYAELLRSINKLTNALKRRGLQQGDRVAILLGNRPEFVVSYFAVMRAGGIAVTLNPVSTVYELNHYFAESRPKFAICTANQMPKLEALKDKAPYIESVFTTERTEGAISLEDVEADESPECTAKDMAPDDPAVVIFTAGLLGRALGATLSHQNLESNSIMLRDQCSGTHEHRSVAIIPMFHAFGAAVNLLCVFQVAATLYLVERVDFPKLIPWLQEARITYTGLVPMVFYGFLYHPACKDLDLRSLEIGISGGAALSMEIYERFCERFGVDVYQGYGLTEASPVVSWNNIRVPNKPQTVGLPIPDVEYQIHDEQGNVLAPGQEGEVVVRGPNVMLGYLFKPQETETVIRNGWLYTGDLGHVDEEGYLTLTGLKKDLIITSGFNVYCQEVEEILIRHPSVSDVALVGAPDLMRGQVIEALVVPEQGTVPEERDIIRFAREYLSRYKCPRKVSFVKEIIRDQLGKPMQWS
jgi:long-chain acyl-CoA synthetase